MGDEKDYEIWLDEYYKDMSTSSSPPYEIDLGSIDIGDITVSGTNDSTWIDFDQWYKNEYENRLGTNNITLTGGGEEMLRVAEDGFYVRGVKVEADAKEAKAVYEAFKQWMTWAIMNGEIKN